MESEQVLVAAPIFVGQEDILAVVAAVGDLMRYVDRRHPGPILSEVRRERARMGDASPTESS